MLISAIQWKSILTADSTEQLNMLQVKLVQKSEVLEIGARLFTDWMPFLWLNHIKCNIKLYYYTKFISNLAGIFFQVWSVKKPQLHSNKKLLTVNIPANIKFSKKLLTYCYQSVYALLIFSIYNELLKMDTSQVPPSTVKLNIFYLITILTSYQ